MRKRSNMSISMNSMNIMNNRCLPPFFDKIGEPMPINFNLGVLFASTLEVNTILDTGMPTIQKGSHAIFKLLVLKFIFPILA